MVSRVLSRKTEKIFRSNEINVSIPDYTKLRQEVHHWTWQVDTKWLCGMPMKSEYLVSLTQQTHQIYNHFSGEIAASFLCKGKQENGFKEAQHRLRV